MLRTPGVRTKTASTTSTPAAQLLLGARYVATRHLCQQLGSGMGLGACALELDVSSYLKCPCGVRGHHPHKACGICLGAEGCFSQAWDTGLTKFACKSALLAALQPGYYKWTAGIEGRWEGEGGSHGPGLKCRFCSSRIALTVSLRAPFFSISPAIETFVTLLYFGIPGVSDGVSDLLSALRKELLAGQSGKITSLAHPLTLWPLTSQFAEFTRMA